MFEDWLKDASVWEPKMSFVERGKKLWETRGCNSCHTIDGGANTGPTWKNMYGYPQPLQSGQQVVADENYIRESIFYPGKSIVKPYTNQMPTYLGQLSENDVMALIWYMRTLSDKYDQSKVPSGLASETLQAGATTQPAAPPAGQPR
jgi:cytochrome c oxidase subunit 2